MQPIQILLILGLMLCLVKKSTHYYNLLCVFKRYYIANVNASSIRLNSYGSELK